MHGKWNILKCQSYLLANFQHVSVLGPIIREITISWW